MTDLAALQAGFRAYLLGGASDAIERAIVDDRPGATARLSIYRNHVRLSLTAALAATFPVVVRLVGEAFFADVANRYIAASPPDQPVLSEYGVDFPGHLANDPRLAAMAWMADVARLEWLLNAAFHADRRPALQPAAFAAVAPEAVADLRLALQPGTEILRSAWPVDLIWLANQPAADGSGVDLQSGPADLLVFRRSDDAAVLRLTSGESAFLQALAAGRTLEDAVSRASVDNPAFDLTAALLRYLDLQILAANL